MGPGAACTSYVGSGVYIDSKWNSARTMTVVADVLAGLTFFLSGATLVPSVTKKRVVCIVLASIAMVAGIFEGLTLLFLRTSICTNWLSDFLYACVRDLGAKLAITATVLWFLAGLTTAFTVPSFS